MIEGQEYHHSSPFCKTMPARRTKAALLMCDRGAGVSPQQPVLHNYAGKKRKSCAVSV